jgi:hypothetical protein
VSVELGVGRRFTHCRLRCPVAELPPECGHGIPDYRPQHDTGRDRLRNVQPKTTEHERPIEADHALPDQDTEAFEERGFLRCGISMHHPAESTRRTKQVGRASVRGTPCISTALRGNSTLLF